MNIQGMFNNSTEDVSNINHSSELMMTKEDIQLKNDEELLEIAQRAKGHTKDFSEYMHCDFSYTYLTDLLKQRGYENGWYKVSDVPSFTKCPSIIVLRNPQKELTRRSYTVDMEVADKWKEFNRNIPYNSITLTYALERFMNDYHCGHIEFKLDI